MFGNEVADIALGYIIALARETFSIHIGVTNGEWPKFQGISLSQKNVALIGLGDIGSQIARRLKVLGMDITAYDPYAKTPDDLVKCLIRKDWPENIEQADFIVLSCSLNSSNKYMLNEKIFNKLKTGVRIVNVGRGPLINQYDLENALKQDIVHSVALDVFEVEPLPKDSYLRLHPKCIFGSHNASNTKDAVIKTSELAIKKIQGYLYE
jgi:D-3-phosphoglycerate dehydrogenase